MNESETIKIDSNGWGETDGVQNRRGRASILCSESVQFDAFCPGAH